ncbi:MAG: hypothetical protein C0407_12010, partial [Desulfobacca sp.]|nr:hypothetical protein [Desulfobacca sp.]
MAESLALVFFMLRPRILGVKNRLNRLPGTRWKVLLFVLLGLSFWTGTFYAFYRILGYFSGIP